MALWVKSTCRNSPSWRPQLVSSELVQGLACLEGLPAGLALTQAGVNPQIRALDTDVGFH